MIKLTFTFTFVRRMQSANEKIKLEEGRSKFRVKLVRAGDLRSKIKRSVSLKFGE